MTYQALTDTDLKILESYKVVMDGLAEYMGNGYEIILHSLENLDHSVIKIINGHYTGREEGAPITDLALRMLDEIKRKKEPEAKCYFNKKNGSTLKSATIPILGEHKRIIGLLCINFHMETSFSNVISAFIPALDIPAHAIETFSDNVENLISSSIEEARVRIYSNPAISTANKNKAIVQLLFDKGIFNMKDAVIQVAKCLGISKNTVYLHLRNLEK